MRRRGPDDPGAEDWLEGESWTEEPTESPEPRPRWPRGAERRPLARWHGRRLAVAAVAVLAVAVVGAVLLGRALGGGDEAAPVSPTVEAPVPTEEATTPTATTELPRTLPDDVRLGPGDRGRPVRRLQRALVGLGYEPGPVDGVYGEGTAEAVRAFQRDAGLEADGVAGEQTIAALNARLAERG